jgi:hypothetical protein
MLRWGPAGVYTAKISGEYGGLGYGMLDHTGSAVLHGGGWDASVLAGVFAARLDYFPASPNGGVGFR